MLRIWHKPSGLLAFGLAVHYGGSRKLPEMLTIWTDCGWRWVTPDGGGWLGLSESADRVLWRSFRLKLRMVGGRRRQGVVGNYRGGAGASMLRANDCEVKTQLASDLLANGHSCRGWRCWTNTNNTAKTLCRSILTTNKSLLGLTGTNTVKNENLVIIYILTSISIASSWSRYPTKGTQNW